MVDYAYDAAGNLLSKSDYALSYDYAGGGPNAVSAIQKPGGASVVFGYDANGNRTQGDGTSIGYNAFNRPTTITANGVTTTFHYGAGLSRFRQQKDSGETIRYIDTLMEVVTVGSSSDYRHYLGDTALLTKTGDLDDPYPALRYTLRDRLGSVVTLLKDSGLATERRGFGPFGTPRNGDGSTKTPPLLGSGLTARGFTGHEHLDDSELIHMNGRLYDYRLGQFMSVDPLIQDPGNAQSLNPYAYIMNNPLGGTDPTGYRSEKVTGSRIRGPVGSRHTSVIFQQPLRENASVAGLPLRQGIDRLFNNGHAAQSRGRLGEPGGPNGGDGAGDSVDETGAAQEGLAIAYRDDLLQSHMDYESRGIDLETAALFSDPRDVVVLQDAINRAARRMRRYSDYGQNYTIGTVIKGDFGGGLYLGETSSDVPNNVEHIPGGFTHNLQDISDAAAFAIALPQYARFNYIDNPDDPMLQHLFKFHPSAPIFVYSPYDRRTFLYRYQQQPVEVTEWRRK